MSQSVEPACDIEGGTKERLTPAGSQSLIGQRYRLENLLGTGGMGCVHRATDTHTGASVAVKTLRPDLVQNTLVRSRLEREATIGLRVHAPQVVRLLDHGEDAKCGPYVVFEYLRGELLSNLLERNKSLEAIEAVEIAIDILRGLEAFHTAGVLHRDVKPENVFLVGDEARSGSNRAATLIDFGLSRAVGLSADGTERVTLDGIIAGTPEYMPPEQFTDAEGQDQHVDIYATGVVLYQMLAGEPPFAGAEPGTVFEHALHDAARPLAELRPGIDPDLADCVHRAMAREPRDRFPHARAMRLVLSHWLIANRDGQVLVSSVNDDNAVRLPTKPLGGAFGSWLLPRRRAAVAFAASIILGTAIAVAWTSGHHPALSTIASPLDARVAAGAIEFREQPAVAHGDPSARDRVREESVVARPAPPQESVITHSPNIPTARRSRFAGRPAQRSAVPVARPVAAPATSDTSTPPPAAQCARSAPAGVCTRAETSWHGSLLPPTREY